MAKRIIIAEAETDAPKPLRGAPDGTGYRDMARSESSAQELGRPADGKPTAGVGGVRSSEEAGNDRGAEGFIKGIQKELHEKTYRASPLRRKYIEKANGKMRPLGIPTIKDRVVQCAVKIIIEPIFELHWFETIVSLTAKACGQVMSIVRYADDFVILARAWVDGFLKKVEGILEGRMGLTVNREKTKTLDFREPHTTLTFLGYEFRMVRDRLFGTGNRYNNKQQSAKAEKGKAKL